MGELHRIEIPLLLVADEPINRKRSHANKLSPISLILTKRLRFVLRIGETVRAVDPDGKTFAFVITGVERVFCPGNEIIHIMETNISQHEITSTTLKHVQNIFLANLWTIAVEKPNNVV
jgi:hypothetical protein